MSELTPDQIVDHIKQSLRDSGLGYDEKTINESVRTKDDDPGGWCGERGGVAWIWSEVGLGTFCIGGPIDEWMMNCCPDGYFAEPVNNAVAVVYEV